MMFQVSSLSICFALSFDLTLPKAFTAMPSSPPKAKAWEAALSACRDWINENPDYEMDIVFAVLDKDILEMGKNIQGMSKTGW